MKNAKKEEARNAYEEYETWRATRNDEKTLRPKLPSDIDCQADKNHENLEIAQQNQGAQQAGAHELEINYIMDKYKKTGALPDLIKTDPTYGDFSKPLDLRRAYEIVEKAEEQFGALDSHIRSLFTA